jgi:dTMP kinase
MKAKRFYGKGLPGVKLEELGGVLIVIEGPDGSGRSTQSSLLRAWLEHLGYPTAEIGLKRSGLVGVHLEEAMGGNVLCPLTLNLFYATDFADQLENSMISALRAGFVVVADRYIYTLMARGLLRGADREWLREIYGVAPVPDLSFYLKVSPKALAERSLQKTGHGYRACRRHLPVLHQVSESAAKRV